jgi:hypothetical protein
VVVAAAALDGSTPSVASRAERTRVVRGKRMAIAN